MTDRRFRRRRGGLRHWLTGLFGVVFVLPVLAGCDPDPDSTPTVPWTGSITYTQDVEEPFLAGSAHLVQSSTMTVGGSGATEKDHDQVHQPLQSWEAEYSWEYADGCYFRRITGSGAGGQVGTVGEHEGGGLIVTYLPNGNYQLGATGPGDALAFAGSTIENPGCTETNTGQATLFAQTFPVQGRTGNCRALRGTYQDEGWAVSWNLTRPSCHVELLAEYSFTGSVSGPSATARGADYGRVTLVDRGTNPRVTTVCLRSQWTASLKRTGASTLPLEWNGQTLPFPAGSPFQFIAKGVTSSGLYYETVRLQTCGPPGSDLHLPLDLVVSGPGFMRSLRHFSVVTITSAPGKAVTSETTTLTPTSTSIEDRVVRILDV